MQIVTVVAVTFNHGRILRAFCDNLLNQHGVEGKWKAIILHDGDELSTDQTARRSAEESYDYMMDFEGGPFEKSPFEYIESPQRANCHGHDLRARGLEMVTTPWVHFTNADNQYCYGWLERVIPVIERENPDFIYWPCSHSYREFDLFDPQLRGGGIDFCNYMLKTELAKEMGFPWRHFEADGAQVEEFVRRFPQAKIRKMTGVFSIHN